ncbi:hypothetical protein CQW23_14352 [Capsicum baccatum]|uniref:Protein kinase domain-containing protein n=1 Tax=Capsicum baccatum TaxID=33114 RepID=A0A2G2WIX9_CAPBA|nr:hypothetical protein CQW23_14352 [Capsicum baccatum]
MNLREMQKKFGQNIRLNLSGVNCYAKQVFGALKHLKSWNVLNCDVKPDNFLVSGLTVVSFPEVADSPTLHAEILGLTYDPPMDVWSVGCCLFELYATKIFLPEAVRKLAVNIKLKDISSVISGDSSKEFKTLAHFEDLMERIFVLDPVKRITASQALEHLFIIKMWRDN